MEALLNKMISQLVKVAVTFDGKRVAADKKALKKAHADIKDALLAWARDVHGPERGARVESRASETDLGGGGSGY